MFQVFPFAIIPSSLRNTKRGRPSTNKSPSFWYWRCFWPFGRHLHGSLSIFDRRFPAQDRNAERSAGSTRHDEMSQPAAPRSRRGKETIKFIYGRRRRRKIILCRHRQQNFKNLLPERSYRCNFNLGSHLLLRRTGRTFEICRNIKFNWTGSPVLVLCCRTTFGFNTTILLWIKCFFIYYLKKYCDTPPQLQ